MLNVVCVKRGTTYSSQYVNNLYHMVSRHLTLSHQFICLTEDGRGLEKNIHVHPFCDMRLQKWWNKLELFKPHPVLRGKRTLFFDLDTVIVGNINSLAQYEGDFAILYDMFAARSGMSSQLPLQSPMKPWLGSAVMSIAPEFGTFLWNDIQKNVSQTKKFHGDQQYIGKKLLERKICPDIWQILYPECFQSYKASRLDRAFKDEYAKNLRVVCFHGKPRPHEALHLSWMKEHWR